MQHTPCTPSISLSKNQSDHSAEALLPLPLIAVHICRDEMNEKGIDSVRTIGIPMNRALRRRNSYSKGYKRLGKARECMVQM